MTYTYRNKKTGEEIVTSNKVHGKNWELVEDDLDHEAENYEDPFAEDPDQDTEQENPAEEPEQEDHIQEPEETAAPKPKTRRSKK